MWQSWFVLPQVLTQHKIPRVDWRVKRNLARLNLLQTIYDFQNLDLEHKKTEELDIGLFKGRRERAEALEAHLARPTYFKNLYSKFGVEYKKTDEERAKYRFKGRREWERALKL